MLSFLNTAFLWALPLAAIPVIIHLLHRRRREVVPWGAMRFLIQARPRQRQIWRIQDLLLMLLRLLAFVLIILAFAQPKLRSRLFGFSDARDVVLIVETPMSMARVTADGSLFDETIDRAEQIIDQLRPGDFIRVLLASNAPQWLEADPKRADSKTKSRLRDQLRGLQSTLGSADMLLSLQDAIDAGPAHDTASRLLIVLTDGQSHGWRAEAASGWRGLKNSLLDQEHGAALKVVTIGDPANAIQNLTVGDPTASRSFARPGEVLEVSVEVRNTGTVASRPGLLSWECTGQPLGVTSVAALAPGESTSIPYEAPLIDVGIASLTCCLSQSDDLDLDNDGQLIVEVVKEIPVLIVEPAMQNNDPPNADPMERATPYLMAALGYDVAGREIAKSSVFRPTTIDSGELNQIDLADYVCIIFSDPPPLSNDSIGQLRRFVGRGGGLWLALGAHADPMRFNHGFYRSGAGLSPMPLGAPEGDPTDHEVAMPINPPATFHPATVLLGDTERLDIDRARIYRRHQFATGDRSFADVEVMLTTVQGAPLVVEQAFGRGRVIVQATPLGTDWSNLPLCQAYVVMVHEWLWRLVEPGMTRWNLEAGEALAASLPADRFGSEATVTTPEGRTRPAAVEWAEGRRIFHYSQTLRPGAYSLNLAEGGNEVAMPFYVKRDAAESDLTPLNLEQMQRLQAVAGIEWDAEPLAAASTGREVQPNAKPIWDLILATLIVLLAAELILGGWINHRRTLKASGPGVEL